MRYILVEFDGTARSRATVQYAAEVAAECGARLHVIWIVRWPPAGLDVALDDATLDETLRCAFAQLHGLRSECGWLPANTKVAVRVGGRVSELVRYAQEFSVRDVILADDRRLPRFMSTAARVQRMLEGTACRVTIVTAEKRSFDRWLTSWGCVSGISRLAGLAVMRYLAGSEVQNAARMDVDVVAGLPDVTSKEIRPCTGWAPRSSRTFSRVRPETLRRLQRRLTSISIRRRQ